MNRFPDYTYRRIKNDYIRVLHLSGTDAKIDGSKIPLLQGTLNAVCLERPGTFDAISYACEGQKNSDYILIDGQKVGITKNCRDGLRHLRDTFGVKTIWVDAVCIAPSKDEKGQQLPLMTDIYGKARKVYIWLGEPKEGVSGRALDWLQEISLDNYPLLGMRLSNIPKNMHYREIAKAMRLLPQIVRAKMRWFRRRTPAREYDHEAMRDIIGRQWLTRMWTMQEAAMAESPVVVCGEKEIRWNNFFWGIYKARSQTDNSVREELSNIIDSLATVYLFWLEIYQISEFRKSKHRMWVPEDSSFYEKWIAFLDFMENSGRKLVLSQITLITAMIIRRVLRGLRPLDSVPLIVIIFVCALTALLTPPRTNTLWDDGLRRTFVNLMSKTRRQGATEPKDKVYALYGLLKKLEIKLPKPDYADENSLEHTYSAFTRSIIQWHRSLEILREAEGPWGSNGPSWVPDWSRPYRQLQLRDSRASMEYLSHTDSPPFKISNNLRELIISGKKIGVLMVCVGTIQGFSVAFDVNEDSVSSIQILHQVENITTLRKWLNAVKDVFSSMGALEVFLASIPSLQNTHTSNDIVEWTQILLKDRPTTPRAESDVQRFMGQPITPESRQRILREIPLLDRLSTSLEWQIFLKFATDKRMWPLHQEICFILAEQAKFFLAKVEDSYLFGAGPNHCQEGDIVVLLPTLSIPMVARTVDNSRESFHLMGAAHIPQLSRTDLWPKDEANRDTIILV